MSAETYTLQFDGRMTQRGFWLYVWRITTPDNGELLYVGRTGDSSSPNASSPFNRMGQHLGTNKNANAIRRLLEQRCVKPEACTAFKMVAYGPLFPEVKDMGEHKPVRDKVAALEAALAHALQSGEYEVLHTVNSRQQVEQILWEKVRAAFSCHFPKIGPGPICKN